MTALVGAEDGIPGAGGNAMRLRTLTMLRWMAICGQLVAITVATRWFGLSLATGICYLAVGASIVANLVSTFVFPESRRLTETEALAILLFDVVQLCVLILVTGGMTNPFALLILAPVTISASALGLRSTFILGAVAVSLVTLALFRNIPITLRDGGPFTVPPLFEFGFWLSIVVGIVFLGFYARRISSETRAMSEALLATQMALAREQKLTDLGGVVAAAAHELGTPLATIKLASSELIDDLSDWPELQADARLIRDQADRCRDILRGMGRAGKDDLQTRQAPLGALLREAAEPHVGRGRELVFSLEPLPGGEERQPNVLRRPEVIHGLRNLIQNAVDFARSHVWIDGEWSASRLTVRIVDDGPGYPPSIIGRIGDPFVRSRRPEAEGEAVRGGEASSRPGYEGMGLGLFIAKTLLERTGAELVFANGADPFLAPEEQSGRGGAVVEVSWHLADMEAPADLTGAPNTPIRI